MYEYDDDGRLTRSVTRQLEPAWDDTARGMALGLQRYDDDCCTGCGLHESVLADPDNNVFTFEDHVCRVCAGVAINGRVVADAHQKADKKLGDDPSPRARRAGDGHSIKIRRATPDEVAARKASPSITQAPKSKARRRP